MFVSPSLACSESEGTLSGATKQYGSQPRSRWSRMSDLEHAHAALGMDAEEACQPPFCGEMAPQRSGLRAAAQIRQGIVKQMIVARRLRGVFRLQRADGAGRDLGRRRLQVQQRLIGLLSVQAKFALHGVGGLVRCPPVRRTARGSGRSGGAFP